LSKSNFPFLNMDLSIFSKTKKCRTCKCRTIIVSML
jgi:hypothetical protein